MQKRLVSERGTALIEVTLVLPVLLILFLGIVEVGFLLLAHVQVTNAAREGARQGSLCRLNGNCDTLTDVVRATVFGEAQWLEMDGGNTQVVVQPSSLSSVPSVGDPITVTVTYDHASPFISNFVPMFPAELPVEHKVVMHFDR